MPRKPLPLGSWGQIRTYGLVDGRWVPKGKLPKGTRAKSWRAMASYRGYDGHTRQVERSGTSETKAINQLRGDLAEMSGRKTSLTSGSRMSEAIKIYTEHVKTEVSATTFDAYTGKLRTHVEPALGELLVRECTVGRLDKFMTDLKNNGASAGTRRTIRNVLSGVMGLATRHEIFAHNPVRDLSPIKGDSRQPKAFSTDQLSDFLTNLDADKKAARADLPDLVRFLFGTGVRIGEALGLRWCDLNLADEPITIDGQVIPPMSVWINGNIVRVRKKNRPELAQVSGLVRNSGKTFSAKRVVGLPHYLYTLLLVRKPLEATDDEAVFPSRTLGYRDPSGVQKQVRDMRRRAGYPSFTTHVGRKTVATALDAAGHTARQIADQLGHANPSMTQNRYMGRGMANAQAAADLDKLHHPG
jgi:integrase